MRIIRWVGHPSPLDDANIRRNLARQKLDTDIALAFSRFEHNRRISVLRGQSIFRVGKEHGYSRPYVWGPFHFDVEMEDRDWQRLQRNPIDRHMMMDVTAGVPPFRPLLTAAEWRELIEAAKRTQPPAVLVAM